MSLPIRNTIPALPRRRALTPSIEALLPGQSVFVPGFFRGYQLASRFRKKGRQIFATRVEENGVKGTVFWREEVKK